MPPINTHYALDWAAPIEPGVGMFGLYLGMSRDAVESVLGHDAMSGQVVTFANSPRLIVDAAEEDAIYLRGADIKIVYAWQNCVARLVFDQGVLTSIIAEILFGEEAFGYKGKMFGNIGLGSPISELLAFGQLEYDDAEEIFYSDWMRGVEVGAATACDLVADPNQIIPFIRVFSPRV